MPIQGGVNALRKNKCATREGIIFAFFSLKLACFQYGSGDGNCMKALLPCVRGRRVGMRGFIVIFHTSQIRFQKHSALISVASMSRWLNISVLILAFLAICFSSSLGDSMAFLLFPHNKFHPNFHAKKVAVKPVRKNTIFAKSGKICYK
jgi:hypothetical protein